jgi:hypothetical protein
MEGGLLFRGPPGVRRNGVHCQCRQTPELFQNKKEPMPEKWIETLIKYRIHI